MLALPAVAFGQTEVPPAQNQISTQTQVPAPSPAPPQAETAAQTPAPPAAQPPQPVEPLPRPRVLPAPQNRRHSIRMMEAVLSRAVLGGAEQLAEQLGNGSPNMSFFTGQARAHGFVLDGYGVFFHVEIPEMQTSLVMSVTTLDRDMAVAECAGVAPQRRERGARERLETAGGGGAEAPGTAGRADARRCRRAERRFPQHDSHCRLDADL